MHRETALYPAIKALLEGQGYTVKGEVGAADVMARRDGGDPVLIEMKLRFSLSLFHQAVARLAVSDQVYIAVPRPTGRDARRSLRDNRALCRRLGLGLILVDAQGRAEVICDPGPYLPRKSKQKAARLLREFQRLQGDPNDGGATRHGIVTAYRQDALRCAAHLAQAGPSKGGVVAQATGVARATRLMADNHYGWFERVEKGVYALTSQGRQGLVHWAYSWDEAEAGQFRPSREFSAGGS
jgi:hypothetical protein